jgi:hypothetical protein
MWNCNKIRGIVCAHSFAKASHISILVRGGARAVIYPCCQRSQVLTRHVFDIVCSRYIIFGFTAFLFSRRVLEKRRAAPTADICGRGWVLCSLFLPQLATAGKSRRASARVTAIGADVVAIVDGAAIRAVRVAAVIGAVIGTCSAVRLLAVSRRGGDNHGGGSQEFHGFHVRVDLNPNDRTRLSAKCTERTGKPEVSWQRQTATGRLTKENGCGPHNLG